MSIKKFLIPIWLIIALVSTFSYAAKAQAVAPDFTLSYASQPGPLFTEANLAPGDIRTQPVGVTNHSSQDKNFALNLVNFFGSSDQKLAQALNYQLSRNNILIASGNITELRDQETNIETIPANQTYIYNFAIKMKDVGNDYQHQNIGFDIVFGFKDSGTGIKAILGESTGPAVTQELPQTGMDVTWSVLSIFGLILISLLYHQVLPRKSAR